MATKNLVVQHWINPMLNVEALESTWCSENDKIAIEWCPIDETPNMSSTIEASPGFRSL
jgi:hypothetical protein